MIRVKNRCTSFVIITAVYILAAAVGVAVYRALPFGFEINLLLADIAATVLTFVSGLVFGNASVYDPYWSVQPPVILTAFAVGRALTPVRALMLVAVWFWGVRLTANWAYTFGGLTHQDWRYTMLAESTGKLYPVVNFFGIHLVPTLVVYACTLPAVYLFMYDADISSVFTVFAVLSLLAALMQGIADIQMHSYRKGRSTPFIRVGLWKYSRHPNYLGEILMWWGVGLAAVSVMPERYYLLAGALMNTALFLFISIPMADRRQSRKAGFPEYKAATRMLLPIRK